MQITFIHRHNLTLRYMVANDFIFLSNMIKAKSVKDRLKAVAGPRPTDEGGNTIKYSVRVSLTSNPCGK